MESFREAYGVLQRHAQTLRNQDEPNIDDLLTIVTESVNAYKVCKQRIDAVEAALKTALDGAGVNEAPDPAPAPPEAKTRASTRPAPAPADPFFNQPYEAPPEQAEAPAWEQKARPARSGVSANIKPKRKVAALFKAVEKDTPP